MLLYNRGRICCGCASFAIPNNCMILTDEMESLDAYGIHFANASASYTVLAKFINSEQEPQTEMMEITASVTSQPSVIVPYEKNGMSGCYTAYRDRHYSYLEFLIVAETGVRDREDMPLNRLSVIVVSEDAAAIDQAISDNLIWDLVNSLTVSK